MPCHLAHGLFVFPVAGPVPGLCGCCHRVGSTRSGGSGYLLEEEVELGGKGMLKISEGAN